MTTKRLALLAAALAVIVPCAIAAQVTPDRIVRASAEPQNWLTYSGGYFAQRHTELRDITPANLKDLEMKWVFQAQSLNSFLATPIVVDGVMYLTQAPNDVVALDAKNGRVFWTYHYEPKPGRVCCRGLINRGVAIMGDTVYMATVDAHLIAIDAKNGQALWKTKVAEAQAGYAMTLAPLAIKDKVIVGTAGGEYGIRGFIAAYDAKSGKEVWKRHTIPGPGEKGHETWPNDDSWQHGGASVWTTGSYDPETNLTFWGIGNPGPDFNSAQREGDNLYSDSVIAIDADTGELKWYFQFTPNDPYDYDSTQVPVLADMNWQGRPRKVMLFGNRNGFFYVLDRTNGQFLQGKAYANVNWARGLDAKGRPIVTPQPPGKPTFPGPLGATNWYSPSYSPRTGLFYISTWENYGQVFAEGEKLEYKEGQNFTGGNLQPVPGQAPMPGMQRGPVNTWHEGAARGIVKAIDPTTATTKWAFQMHDVTTRGIMTTATDVLFVGGREGYFQALDAKNGNLLWKAILGGETSAAPMSYAVDGKQYVAIAAGHSLFTFGLRQ
jgi:alcohol dehydrogenase (cytochrome c)